MSSIEAKITIDVEDLEDVTQIIETLRSVISSINDRETQLNVIDMDGTRSAQSIIRR